MDTLIFRPVFAPLPVLACMAALIALRLVLLLSEKKNIGRIVSALLRMGLVLALIFIINLRPMLPDPNVEAEMKNVDVLFVLDTTLSMWASDYAGPRERMEAAKADCEHIMDRLYGGNFALVRFDNTAQVLSPFTQDAKNVKDALSTILPPDENYALGSDLSAPYKEMETLFLSSSMKEDRKTVVFFLSDGEITNLAELVSYKALSSYVDGGAVLGYGTAEGGRMRLGGMRSIYVKDPETGGDAVSVINEANLRQISADLGVDYVHMTAGDSADYILETLLYIGTPRMEKTRLYAYRDIYPWFVYPLLLLLALELFLFVARGRV